jgi:3-hydroxyacyl-CoA dehydrogenase
MDDIRTIGIVGTGVIGASWTAYFLAKGFDVRATDPASNAEANLRKAVAAHWPVLTELGLAKGASPNRLVFDADLEKAAIGCDFVQENGPERSDIKENLFHRLAAILPADVVLASSSSGLPMTPVQANSRFPERIMLGHPFNPPHLIPLVEVGGGEKTADAMIDRAMAFYAAIGKKPIRLRQELKGHIANRLQAALWREVFHLLDIGAATVADIEVAIAHGPGLRWGALGPFAHLHLSGGDGGIAHLLAHLGGPIETWWDDLGSPRMSHVLMARVAEQTNSYYGASTMPELGAWRDRIVRDLLKAKSNRGDRY